MNEHDLIVITGAGGFIAGNLVLYFKKKGLLIFGRSIRSPYTTGTCAFPESKVFVWT